MWGPPRDDRYMRHAIQLTQAMQRPQQAANVTFQAADCARIACP
jgi:hypothetical protein